MKGPAGPAIGSMLAHGFLILALLAVHSVQPGSLPTGTTRNLLLLEPTPAPVRVPVLLRPRHTDEIAALENHFPVSRRPFEAPGRVVTEIRMPELPAAPEIAVSLLTVPIPESSPTAIAPEPSLKTDNLSAAGVPRAASSTAVGLEPVGFSSVSAGGSRAALVRASPPAVGAGFAEVIASRARRPALTPPDAPGVSTPLEILDKPRPAYSAEGRRLQIEGEVLLDVLFLASGEVRVRRVIRGLGRGLDENAVFAAQAIRFRPAQHAGAAVDFSAIVHITFKLAY